MSYPRYQLSGAAKAPGGSSLQDQVSAQLDSLFAQYLDMYQQIRDARETANASIKEGHFQLLQARHAAPNAAFDSSAYSGREMLPAWYARASAVDPNDEIRGVGDESARVKSIDGPARFHLETVTLKEVTLDGDDALADDLDEEVKQMDAMTLRQRGGSKTDTKDTQSAASSSTSAPSQPAALDLRQSPAHWFGALSPPSLTLSGAAFQSALTPLLTIASLTHQLTQVQRKFVALSQLQQASHVDPNVEHELREILEKIKISDERKAKAKELSEQTTSASSSSSN